MGDGRTSTGTPGLSVVVPVYGVEDYLETCLDSILAESANGVEVIAVDDASPDRCGEILDEYARRDPRLRVVHLPVNVGLGPARNAGLQYVTGDYVWFVDSDDWLPPGALGAVRERLAATRPDVLIVDHAEVFEGGRAVPRTAAGALGGASAPLPPDQRAQLLRLAHYACTKVVRKAYLDETELRFRTGWYEDCAYGPLLLMAARSIDLLDRVGYCYRQRSNGQITATVSTRHFEVFDQYESVFEAMERAGGAYDLFRPELFRLMINHYLVVAGNDARLPAHARREFFHRIAREYRRWLPADGYPLHGRVTRLKHRLVRHDSYLAYAALRGAHRVAGRLRRAVRADGARPGDAGAVPPLAAPRTVEDLPV